MIETIARVAYEADRAASGGISAQYGPDLLAESPRWANLSQAVKELVCADVEAALAGMEHPDPMTAAIIREMAADEYDADPEDTDED